MLVKMMVMTRWNSVHGVNLSVLRLRLRRLEAGRVLGGMGVRRGESSLVGRRVVRVHAHRGSCTARGRSSSNSRR